MNKIIKKLFKSSIISSIALLAFAILLIFQSEATIITTSYIIGSLLVALGVVAVLKFFRHMKETMGNDLDIVYGLVCIILGVLVIKNPEAIASVIPFVLGLVIIINSATKMQYSIELHKEKNELWLSTLILSLIMVVCGIVLVFNPFKGAVLLTRIIGIFVLIYSVLDLISTFVISRTFREIQDTIEEKVKDAEVIEEKTVKKKASSKNKEEK